MLWFAHGPRVRLSAPGAASRWGLRPPRERKGKPVSRWPGSTLRLTSVRVERFVAFPRQSRPERAAHAGAQPDGVDADRRGGHGLAAFWDAGVGHVRRGLVALKARRSVSRRLGSSRAHSVRRRRRGHLERAHAGSRGGRRRQTPWPVERGAVQKEPGPAELFEVEKRVSLTIRPR